MEIARYNKWIAALLLYSAVSIMWSKYPEVAMKRWIKLFGSVVMALIVLSESMPAEAISTLFRRCFLVHIPMDWVFVKYVRNLGTGWDDFGTEMWTGLTIHKNVLGQVCMTAGLYFIWDLFKKPGKSRSVVDLVYLVLIFLLMNGPGYSKSASALLGLFIGIIVFFSLGFVKKELEGLNKFLAKGALVFLVLILIVKLGVWGFTEHQNIGDATLDIAGRDSTLTGRTDLWGDVLGYASKNPIVGVGYGSFWIGSVTHNLWDKHYWRPTQGHNGYLDIYVELGLIGLILFGGVLFSAFKSIRNRIIDDFDFGRFQMALFSTIVIHNITESSFMRGELDLWFVFLLVALNGPSPIPGRIPVSGDLAEHPA